MAKHYLWHSECTKHFPYQVTCKTVYLIAFKTDSDIWFERHNKRRQKRHLKSRYYKIFLFAVE